MSKRNRIAEVISPGTLIKDGSTIMRRIPWRGGRGAIVVSGYAASVSNITNFTCYLENKTLVTLGGFSDPAINAVDDNGLWPFELPAGVLVFTIQAGLGNDLSFTDGVHVVEL